MSNIRGCELLLKTLKTGSRRTEINLSSDSLSVALKGIKTSCSPQPDVPPEEPSQAEGSEGPGRHGHGGNMML